jgi:short-subunit dehydrogenase
MSASVVVITGASGGVGRATAGFSARGTQVALLARGEQGLEATADDVELAGGDALVLPVDVGLACRGIPLQTTCRRAKHAILGFAAMSGVGPAIWRKR